MEKIYLEQERMHAHYANTEIDDGLRMSIRNEGDPSGGDITPD